MKTVSKIGAQGELLLVRVDTVPEKAKRVSPRNGKLIVGHSETGHHHAIDVKRFPGVELFGVSDDALDGYLKVGRPFADLVHLRDFDTHETLRLPDGNYRIRRQREHSIEGWVPVLD